MSLFKIAEHIQVENNAVLEYLIYTKPSPIMNSPCNGFNFTVTKIDSQFIQNKEHCRYNRKQ